MKFTGRLLLAFLLILTSISLNAQTISNFAVPSSSVPFLSLSGQPRNIGVGDITVVGFSNTFQNEMTNNPSLLAGYKDRVLLNFSYKPFFERVWLGGSNYENQFLKNIFLLNNHLQYNFKGKNSIASDVKLFKLGEITFTDQFGNFIGSYKPIEIALKLSYARLFDRPIRLGIGVGFVYSNLVDLPTLTAKAKGVIVDIGVDGFKTIVFSNGNHHYTFNYGIAIQNLGNKLKYNENSVYGDLPPSVLKLGVSNVFQIEPVNASDFFLRLMFGYQTSKLLVPTPSNRDDDQNGIPDYIENNWFKSVFGSFADADGGAKEEMKEFIHHIGGGFELYFAEVFYFYSQFGAFIEHETKGGRRTFNFNPGIGIANVELSYAYSKSLNNNPSPLVSSHNIGIAFIFTISEGKHVNNKSPNPLHNPVEELIEYK